MAEEIVFTTRVDTGQTAQDVKKVEDSLKKAGQAARDTASNMTTIATDSKKSMTKILTSTDSAEKKMADLNKVVKEAPINFRDMNKQIQAYQSIALQAGRTSPIGREALAQAAAIKDRMVDLQNETKRLSDDQKNLKGVMQIGQTTLAGYGAFNGMLALTGSNNEALRQTMVKLQAVQTVLVSLDQIKTALQKESNAMLLLNNLYTKGAIAVQTIYAAVIGTTTGALKVAKIAALALMAVPIVLLIAGLIAGIAALVNFITSWKSEEEKLAEAQKAQAEARLKQLKSELEAIDKVSDLEKQRTDFTLKDIELKKRQAKLAGATDAELAKIDQQGIDRQKAGIKREIDLQKQRELNNQNKLEAEAKRFRALAKLEEAGSAQQQRYNKYAADFEQSLANQKEIIRKGNSLALGKLNQELYALDLKTQEDALAAQKELDKKEADERKKRADEYKKRKEEEAKLELERVRLLSDLMIENIEDENLRSIAKLQEGHRRDRDETIKKFGQDTALLKELELSQSAELDELKKQISDAEKAKQDEADAKKIESDKKLRDLASTNAKAELEGKLIQMRDDFDKTMLLKAELAQLELEQALEQENITEGEKFKIKQEYDQKIEALNKERAEHDKKLEQDVHDTRERLANQGFAAAKALTDAVFAIRLGNAEKGSKEEEKRAKRQFQFNKALQLGGAIMDSSKAIMASLASAPIAIGAIPNPAGIASLAFVAIQSAASIASIAATKFQGSGGGGGASVGAPSIPQEVTDASGGENGNTTLTSGLQGSGSQPNKPNKVVLVDSDVKASLDESARVQTVSSVG